MRVCDVHVNQDSNTNMALSNNYYLAPGPGYGVFVRAHIGCQTFINFLCSVQSRFKVTSQRPVGLAGPARFRKKVEIYLKQHPDSPSRRIVPP